MVLAVAAVLALSGKPCWTIYDDALRHRAAEPHPVYVRYDESTSLIQDGFPIVRATASIAYRQDGMARVSDSRFDGYSYVTNRLDPGPPELGPYGPERAAWLPVEAPLPVIGDVHAHSAKSCTNLGLEEYRGHTTYHLVLVPQDEDAPSLKELWVDASTAEVWKIIVSGRLFMVDAPGKSPLTDFEVEMAQEGPYVMVQHVTWQYRMPVYSQYSNLFGEYYLSDFTYPANVPSEVFAIDSDAKS